MVNHLSYFSTKKYPVGTEKNHLYETIHMFKFMGKKRLPFYTNKIGSVSEFGTGPKSRSPTGPGA